MRRTNPKNALTSWILTATLTVMHVGAQAASLKDSEDLAVHPLVDLATPTGGPFPSDRFTVRDRTHNTGRRISLPKPDCHERPSDCEDIDVINTLDGFNLQPRLSIPFDGPIDVNSVTGETVFLISLGSTPVVYSRHLRKAPLVGVPPKSVIIQFAKGDQAVPNPATTAMLRAGDLADRTTYFRNDLAFAENPAVPKNPHGFMLMIGSAVPLVVSIARGAQEQIAVFFASDGAVVIRPEPARFFEVPIAGPPPEDLGYIR